MEVTQDDTGSRKLDRWFKPIDGNDISASPFSLQNIVNFKYILVLINKSIVSKEKKILYLLDTYTYISKFYFLLQLTVKNHFLFPIVIWKNILWTYFITAEKNFSDGKTRWNLPGCWSASLELRIPSNVNNFLQDTHQTYDLLSFTFL